MANFTHYRVKNDEQTPIMKDTFDKEIGCFLKDFSKNLKIKILSMTDDVLIFDLIGVDASIANALRRVLLAEVPTMAIETVYIQNNTSIIQDEILAHRLGLIPIKADPQMFEECAEGEDPTDQNTIVFRLDVECQPPPGHSSVSVPTASGVQPYTEVVYTRHLEYQPQGDQEDRFPDGIAPVSPDIIIAKLREGQHIQLEAHCRKGVGKDHAKFSPCATASYRLLPEIVFPTPITGDLAGELAEMCPLQVFDIEDIRGVPTAVAARPRDCTMCRECIRREGWDSRVQLRRVANHFIFTVESSGCIAPVDLVKQAISVLRKKAETFKGLVDDFAAFGPQSLH